MRLRNGDYGIFPRRSRKTVFFYYWIYDNDGNRKFRSTGKQTYNEALRYCRNLQIKGLLHQGTSYSFDTYTKDFFDYEKCPYISNRLLRGYSYGRTWANRQRSLLTKVIQPHFSNIDIRVISTKMIDEFLLHLRQSKKSNKTLNHIITSLKAIFNFAAVTGLIETNPTVGIKPFKINAKEKGIFKREELSLLFSNPEKTDIWINPMHFLLNCIAATTGLRLGEILALQPENINEKTINVLHSWNCIEGLKGTKSGKTRIVPISSELSKALFNFISVNKISKFIFSVNGKTPIDHKTVYKNFWFALLKIGINNKLRAERNITFHSYRHTFNSLLLELGMHPEALRLLTGHSSAAMTERYSHIQLCNIPDIIEKLPVLY